ncbi:hypothetical protein Efla_002230 [Eimeria flavescens]
MNAPPSEQELPRHPVSASVCTPQSTATCCDAEGLPTSSSSSSRSSSSSSSSGSRPRQRRLLRAAGQHTAPPASLAGGADLEEGFSSCGSRQSDSSEGRSCSSRSSSGSSSSRDGSSRCSNCLEGRQGSIPASVAASTAPSAAVAADAASAAAVWGQQTKQQTVEGEPFFPGDASAATATLSPPCADAGGAAAATAAAAAAKASIAAAAAAVAAPAAAEVTLPGAAPAAAPAAQAAPAAAAPAAAAGSVAKPSVSSSLGNPLSSLGNLLLAFSSSTAPAAAAAAAAAAAVGCSNPPPSSSSSSRGSSSNSNDSGNSSSHTEVQQSQPGASASHSPAADVSPDCSPPYINSSAAAETATEAAAVAEAAAEAAAGAGAAAPPTTLAEAAGGRRAAAAPPPASSPPAAAAAAAAAADEGESAPCSSRLPSLSSDCVQMRGGFLSNVEAYSSCSSSISSSSSPAARLFRWHVGSYAVWTVGSSSAARGLGGGPLSGGPRGAGSSHSEMMQALRRQADIKASVDKAVLLFNKEGLHAALQWLSERGLIDSQDPAAVARFLYDTSGLDKKKVGEVLGGCSAFSLLVLESFASLCDYRGLSIDEALRQFLSKFRPPGEAQQVYRLLYRFASLYVTDNQERGWDLDTVHFLAYAILMLHTDRHNPKVKRKMTKEQFRKIVAAGGAQLQEEVVDCMYDRVVAHEFRLDITESDRVYSRLVNDPRALRHLPASFHKSAESAAASPALQQQQQQQRTDSCSSRAAAAAALPSSSSSSSSKNSSGACASSSLTKPQANSDVCGAEDSGCMDTSLFIVGSVFVKLCRNGRMKRRLIRLSPDHQRLLWGPPNSAGEETAKQPPFNSLPLEELVDITVGCLYTTAKKFELTDEMEARCVSLQFVSRRLDLFAFDLSSATLASWICLFHLKLAQQQQQRQQRLQQQQQQMSQQNRLLLLQESRIRREEAAANKLELWRDEVLPYWESNWSCEALPVAVPSRPSPLAVLVSVASSTTSALIRLPRSVILKHLNRSHKLGLLQRGPPSSRWPRRFSSSARRLTTGVKAGGALAVSLGRATSRQLKRLASLPAAFGGCTGALASCSRHPGAAASAAAGADRQTERAPLLRANRCMLMRRGCRWSRHAGGGGPTPLSGGGAGPPGGTGGLAQQTCMVGPQVAAEANAYIHFSSLGTAWLGRFSLDRGRRLDTATHPAFVRLWLGGLPGELRGKLWLIALGNEQNIGAPLLEALMQAGRLQQGPPNHTGGPQPATVSSSSQCSGAASPLVLQTQQSDEAFPPPPPAVAAAAAAAGGDNGSSTAATGAYEAPSSCVSSSFCACSGGPNPLLEAFRKTPIRGVPYLMGRKVGEGPLLLTTALDELRDEGLAETGGELPAAAAAAAAAKGGVAADMCDDPPFAPLGALGGGGGGKTAAAAGGGTEGEQQKLSGSRRMLAAEGAPLPPAEGPPAHQKKTAAAPPNRHAAAAAAGAAAGAAAALAADVQAGARQRLTTVGAPKGAPALGAPTGAPIAGGPFSPNNMNPLSRGFRRMNSGALLGKSRPPEAPTVGLGAPSPLGGGGGASSGAPGLTEGWTNNTAEANGSGEKTEMTIAEGARLLLEAYVLYRPDVGYVRGMDCLASMLLCFLPVDLAFVALANLLPAVHLLDFFCPALPSNRRSIALKFDFFESMLRLRLPHLYRHLVGLQVIPDLYLMRWLETLFCRALPFATLCRTWDGLLLMGEAYCFQVALGLLKYHESELLCNSFEGCLCILNRHAHPTADEDGSFDASRFFKCVELCRIDSQQYGHWVANQRMSEEKAELLELVACSTV